MIHISEYDEVTGEITCNRGFADEETYELNNANPHVMGSYPWADYYVVDGEAVERPASPVTLDGMTLMNVPPGSTLWIDGESYEAEGDVGLDFPLPGTYQLRVVAWPHKDWEGEVTV